MTLPDRILPLITEKFHAEITKETLPNAELEAINGLIPFFAGRLRREGIKTIKELAKADLSAIIAEGNVKSTQVSLWQAAARILVVFAEKEFQREDQAVSQRILISGLDQAGKTSTIESLQAMKTVGDTRPTLGASLEQYEFIGANLNIWDLGGQRQFHDLYFNDPKSFFARTMVLIYLIDVQKQSRLPESFSYFAKILATLKVLGEKPFISIHLHKMDEEYTDTAKKEMESTASFVTIKIKEILKEYEYTEHEFFKTSIFSIFSLVKAFSTILSRVSPVQLVLNDTLQFYSDKPELQGISGAFLISSKGLPVAEYIRMGIKEKEKIYARIFEEVTEHAALIRNPRSPDYEPFAELPHTYAVWVPDAFMYIIFSPLQTSKSDLYLATVTGNLRAIEEPLLSDLQEHIAPWIDNFFVDIS